MYPTSKLMKYNFCLHCGTKVFLCRILKINWKKNAQQKYIKTYFPLSVSIGDIAEIVFECNQQIVIDNFVNRIIIINKDNTCKRSVMYGKVNNIL